jgi:hypothetical protein
LLQDEKQDFEIVSIDEGMQIDRSAEQPANANSPRFESREPRSKVKSERFSQSQKQDLEIVSIDEGMQIDRSAEQPIKADGPRAET